MTVRIGESTTIRAGAVRPMVTQRDVNTSVIDMTREQALALIAEIAEWASIDEQLRLVIEQDWIAFPREVFPE